MKTAIRSLSAAARGASLLGAMLLALSASAQQPPAGAAPNGPPDMGKAGMPAPATTYHVDVHMQANSAIYQKWPSGGTTWHHGKGYIAPFGGGEYFCGENFPEAKEHPLSDWQKGLFKEFTGRADALFCIYKVKDGEFYVYDSVSGSLATENTGGGGRNQMINLVVGGSGPYKGATGIWLGLTEGTGTMTEVVPGRRLPEVLLKIMDGYVKIPK